MSATLERWPATRGTRMYRTQVFRHPIQAFVFVAPVVLGILTLSLVVPLLIALGAELVILVALPYVPAFRASVDRVNMEDAQRLAAARCQALAERMSPEDRARLQRLEGVVADVIARIGGTGDDTDWHGLYMALATYARLAVARRTIAECFTPVAREAVTRELDEVTDELAWAPALPRPALERRRALLASRHALFAEMKDRSRLIVCELETLTHLLEHAREQCVASVAAPTCSRDVARTLRSVAVNAGSLADIAEINDATSTLDDVATVALAMARAGRRTAPVTNAEPTSIEVATRASTM